MPTRDLPAALAYRRRREPAVIVAVGFCPGTPLLVGSLMGGGAALAEPVRAAARRVVAELLATRPQRVLVVGRAGAPPGPAASGAMRTYSPAARGSLAAFGVDPTEVRGPSGTHVDPDLPLPLTLACWLLDDAGWGGPRRVLGVRGPLQPTQPPPQVLGPGAAGARSVLLAVADGSRCHPEQTDPGRRLDGDPFDARWLAAVRSGSPSALADAGTGRGCCADGLEPDARSVLAAVARATDGSRWVAQVHYAGAPFGVGYLAATWRRRADTTGGA